MELVLRTDMARDTITTLNLHPAQGHGSGRYFTRLHQLNKIRKVLARQQPKYARGFQ
ncbi:MAG: hypothetical protein IPF93_12995 [Saprospiraceae bacterium]|nr:hypothetical protein [Saprospiraceae bacterium]